MKVYRPLLDNETLQYTASGREVVVQVIMGVEEFLRAQARAEDNGMTLADWIRKAVVDAEDGAT